MKRNQSKPGLIKASQLELADIKELLLKYGHPVIDEGEFLAIPTPFFGMYIDINCENSIVDLSGAIELTRNRSLRKQLRLVNWLNNAVPLVRFSLAQSADLDKGIDLVHLPDRSDLWGSIALPLASGFSKRQFVVALDALITGLIHAFAAAVETGFVDAPMCEVCAEQLEAEENSYAL